jgi:Flp pilus assembly pilin Flp
MRFVSPLARAVHQFVRDDSAQELVEYAYLALFVGLAGILVWQAIVGLLGDRYAEYNTNVQGLWEPPDP